MALVQKEIKKVYLGTHQVRPTPNYLMSMANIDEQSDFEVDWVVSSNLLTVSWTNPVVYGYGSSVRYWWGKTKTDITFPTKWEMYLDMIFWTHNYNWESWVWLITDNGWITWRQKSISAYTSSPSFVYPWWQIVTSVNYMDWNRHQCLVTWDNNVYNAWIDGTQVVTNEQSGYTPTNFRFYIVWGRDNSNNIITKSIYDFYIKDLT